MDEGTLERFSRTVAAFHEAAALPERWREALAAAMELLGTTKGALVDLRADGAVLEGLQTLGHDPGTQKAYEAYYFTVDPTRGLLDRVAPLEVAHSYASIDASVRGRHEFFAWARSQDFGDDLSIATSALDGRRHVLAVHRPYDAPPFDEATKAMLRRLGPHLQLARAAQARLRAAGAEAVRLDAALDGMSAAAFIVERTGRVLHLNAAARSLCEAQEGVSVRQGNLALADPRVQNHLEEALRRATAPYALASMIAMPVEGQSDTQVLVVPLAVNEGTTWREPLALVVLAAPPRDAEAIEWRLRQLYDLTAAEARVAAQVALGRTVEDIAAQHGVKPITLRTQLRAVFQKTGTSRQVELVRVALTASGLKGIR